MLTGSTCTCTWSKWQSWDRHSRSWGPGKFALLSPCVSGMVQGQWTGRLTLLAQISWEKWHHQSVDQSIHKAPVSIRMTHPKYKAQQHPTSPQCQYGSTKLTHVIWSAWPFWQKWLVLFPERGNWGSGKLWPVQGYRELGHGRSPLSSGFQWLPGKLSSFINASQSQHLVLPLCSKIFHLVLIVCQALCQGGGVKWIKLTM